MTTPGRPRRSALYLPASNARAIEKSRTLACDVVILDLELPGGVSGFKILQKIRAHPIIKDMPVIIFSGHSGPQELQQGLSLGADAYLSKPAKAEAIIAAIKGVLGG